MAKKQAPSKKKASPRKKRARPAPRKAKKKPPRSKRTSRLRPSAAMAAESVEAPPLPAAPDVSRVTNCEPSIVAPSDLTPLTTALPLGPRQFADDLREPWWTIGDQGHAGACVGWAVGDGLLRWHLVKKNRLPPDERLSVRYFWMAAKELDEYNLWPTTFLEYEGTSIWQRYAWPCSTARSAKRSCRSRDRFSSAQRIAFWLRPIRSR